MRAAAALVLAAAALRVLCSLAGASPALRAGPRRTLSFVPLYTLAPYAKMLDCFTLGLVPLFPSELLSCVAYTTV